MTEFDLKNVLKEFSERENKAKERFPEVSQRNKECLISRYGAEQDRNELECKILFSGAAGGVEAYN